jgi:hypothetical protein
MCQMYKGPLRDKVEAHTCIKISNCSCWKRKKNWPKIHIEHKIEKNKSKNYFYFLSFSCKKLNCNFKVKYCGPLFEITKVHFTLEMRSHGKNLSKGHGPFLKSRPFNLTTFGCSVKWKEAIQWTIQFFNILKKLSSS